MYEVRRMTLEQAPLLLDLADAEGWNPGLHDAEPFFAADPGGFYVGVLNGEPIATISAVTYDDAFAFVGFYIVKAEHRGRGYGLQLFEHALSRLGAHNVGLDGVLAQQANYERSGFSLAYRNVRYEGMVAHDGAALDGVIEASSVPAPQLEAYDRRHFPAPRRAFLRAWISQPGVVALCSIDGADLRGYGVARPCRRGHKVGPLFADDPGAASMILSALCARIEPGAPLFIDVPAPNSDAITLAASRGMSPVFETARMYTRGVPDEGLNGVFGVTSFELG